MLLPVELRAVPWGVAVDRSVLQDGQKVTLQGDLTVYEAKGQYQLRVTEVELQGIGGIAASV
jgi:exonuclease VII large subunit